MQNRQAPSDFATLKARIAERAADLPRRLTQVGTYALENPDDIAFGTVASIAQAADVQPSALVRFSQSLGFDGFSDMQELFRARLRDRVLNYEERVEQLARHGHTTSKSTGILNGFAEAAIKSVSDLNNTIDSAELEQIVHLLARAETIYLVGLRRSFPVTIYMSYAFGKLGVKNVLVDAVGGMAMEGMSFASPKDCVLAISFTPYASETIALAKKAAADLVPVVALTDSPFSPLAAIAKPWLEVQEANFEGFRTLAATMSLAMTLTVAVAGRRKGK